MSMALLIYWVLPVLVLATVSRYFVDTSIPTIDIHPIPTKPVKRPTRTPNGSHDTPKQPSSSRAKLHPQTMTLSTPSPQPSLSKQPTAYQDLVEVITSRRRKSFQARRGDSSSFHGSAALSQSSHTPSTPSVSTTMVETSRSGPPRDPQRLNLMEKIESLRKAHEADPNNLFKALEYGDAMRFYDLQFHEGGTYERDTIRVFRHVVALGEAHRQSLLEAGEPTTKSDLSVHDEVTVDYPQKSADALLCAIYVAQGKVYYMANMFENAEASYTKCLSIAPDYLDALNARGSTNIILGKYTDAAHDFQHVVTKDSKRLFPDAFTGLARVLASKPNATEAGWSGMIPVVEQLIPALTNQAEAYPQTKTMVANILSRLHHVLFTYHDVQTKDTALAWTHLTEAYKNKMSMLPPWQSGFEQRKVNQSKEIFVKGFWPPGVGSDTEVPIFIIGFVRSGSTLLERVLDAHPMIVGTGENSVFNGRLENIRNRIVETSLVESHRINEVTIELADEVVKEMKERWEILEANKQHLLAGPREDPKRFVDKMLTNYYNVGFIHMLYPKAVILHVFREPMDTLFSAYKHEFPPGALDYTSDFDGLAELYHSYRDIMEHWDNVLPGRILHVRYEDMVHDMPGMAKAIIRAVNLPWDESVLEFHKKKHAVNTLSSIQVRKGVYKDSLQSWRKYESHLQPLIGKIGDRVNCEWQTTLPEYKSPVQSKIISSDSKDEL